MAAEKDRQSDSGAVRGTGSGGKEDLDDLLVCSQLGNHIFCKRPDPEHHQASDISVPGEAP